MGRTYVIEERISSKKNEYKSAKKMIKKGIKKGKTKDQMIFELKERFKMDFDLAEDIFLQIV